MTARLLELADQMDRAEYWNVQEAYAEIKAWRAQLLSILDAEGDGGAMIGWVFQHDETGRMAFCENDGVNNPENFAANNPRHVLCGPVDQWREGQS